MEFAKKSFAQFRTIGKAAIVVGENRPTTTEESAITPDVPVVTPIQYAGDTGKETEMSNEMIETCGELFGNAAECVQEYRAEQRENSSIDPITECAYPIAQYTTTCGNDSVTELVGDAAVQYAGDTGKEFTMNTLRTKYVGHLRDTMNYPHTTDFKVVMARRKGLMLAANSMSTAEILMDSTFVRKTIVASTMRVRSRLFHSLRRTAIFNPMMHNLYALLGTPSFVKDELIETYWGYETSCAEIISGYNGEYDSDEAMQADLDEVLGYQRRIGSICDRLGISLCAAVPATTDVPMVTQNAYAGDTSKETVMTDLTNVHPPKGRNDCERATQAAAECVLGQMHDPSDTCGEETILEGIVCGWTTFEHTCLMLGAPFTYTPAEEEFYGIYCSSCPSIDTYDEAFLNVRWLPEFMLLETAITQQAYAVASYLLDVLSQKLSPAADSNASKRIIRCWAQHAIALTEREARATAAAARVEETCQDCIAQTGHRDHCLDYCDDEVNVSTYDAEDLGLGIDEAYDDEEDFYN